MKNSKLFLKIPETAKNFPTETWISQKFPNPSDFPAQTKNSQFGILKSQFGYPVKIPLTETLAQELYVASDRYAVADLKEECINFLQLSIKAENAISLLSWSDKYQVTGIKEQCFAFAVEKGPKSYLYDADGWEDLSVEVFTLLRTRILNKVEEQADKDLYS